MKSSAKNIQMTSYDDLFSVGDAVGTTGEKVQEIPLGELFPFRGHPFKVLDDEAMQEIVKRPAKCEKFLCQKSYSFQGFQPFLTKELNCEK